MRRTAPIELSILAILAILSACSTAGGSPPGGAELSDPSVASPVSPVAQRFASPAPKSSAARKEAIELDVSIAASAELNPDGRGRASPILVRLYELRANALFDSADFFSLQTNDRSVLGSDLLVRDEFILRPGEVKRIQRKSDPEVRAIGVFAGYRDLAEADWRAVSQVPPAPEAAWYRFVVPAQRVQLQIDLLAKGIRVNSSP